MSDVSTSRRLAFIVLGVAIVLHVVALFSPVKPTGKATAGKDYASYHYARQAASQGQSPYDVDVLQRLARKDGQSGVVHPYFYPPPFLLTLPLATNQSLMGGFRLWFWLNELAFIASGLMLWRWLRPLGPAVAPSIVGVGSVLYAVKYSAQLGQANQLVLCLLIGAMWQLSRRPKLAGALLGSAAMFKMAPAILLVAMAVQRRWQVVIWSLVMAVALSAASLLVVGLDDQVRFYGSVLPGLGQGDYNGLKIQIDLFANHSLPNLWHQLAPSGQNVLSSKAKMISLACNIGLVAALAFLLQRRRTDVLGAAAQPMAWLCAMLLIPVFTYEHHLLFAWPAMALLIIASFRGQLSVPLSVLGGLSIAVLVMDLDALRKLHKFAGQPWWIQELKCAALCILTALVLSLGLTSDEGESNVR